MSYLDPSSYTIMLGAQIPSFCRMIGRNKHVWSRIVRMRKSDILQRGSQIKAINIKVYIEHMHREKTDINVLSFFVNKEGEITTTKMLQKHAGSELGLTNCIVFYNICKRSYKYYHLLSTISTSSVTLQKALL